MELLNRYAGAMSKLLGTSFEPEMAAEVEFERSIRFAATMKNGQICENISDVTEIFATVFCNGTGIAYTQDADEDPMKVLAGAYDNARYGNDGGNRIMSFSGETDEGKNVQRCFEESLYSTNEDIERMLSKVDAAFDDIKTPILSRSVQIFRTVNENGIVNSNGFHKETSTLEYECIVDLMLKGHEPYAVHFEMNTAALEDISTEDIIGYVNSSLLYDLPKLSYKGSFSDVVLSPEFMCNVFMTAWQLFTGYAYLSNECVSGAIGRPVFAPMLNIIDKTCGRYGGYSKPYDCQGTKCENVTIVEKGTLKGLLNNLKTSAEILERFRENGIKNGKIAESHTVSEETYKDRSVMDFAKARGNGGRKTTLMGGVPTDIQIVPKCFCIEPGKRSTEEIIASIKDGIYLMHDLDIFHSVDLKTGAFSIPGDGIVIKDGSLVGKVDGLTINGNIFEMLAGIKEIGSETYEAAIDSVRSYLISMPAVRVSGITVTK